MSGRLPGLAFAALLTLATPAVIAREGARHRWPDTPLARTRVLALLQTLNADLLSHDSATLTLERWCDAHGMAAPALVVADRVHGANKPLPPDLRVPLGAAVGDAVKYRHVRLSCGGHVLSEADNWYLPGRLTPTMNRQLDNSDVPFGKVVKALHFRRHTLGAQLLWSPLPAGWEMHRDASTSAAGDLVMPKRLLQHRALLVDGENRPFSALVETYTSEVLDFSHAGSTAERVSLPLPTPSLSKPVVMHLDGSASLYLPDIVSTAYSEVRAAVSPDGDTVVWGSVDRPGGPGGWDIWMIRRRDGHWSAPQPVSFDTAAREFDPAFSADGRTLWFFSNRAGGFGGDDIWSVAVDPSSGTFGTPRNAGAAVNSTGDEWAPAPSPDGTLLMFASNGRGGQGRHDLFISTRRAGQWQAALPLPGDVNTTLDEFDASFVDAGRGVVYARSTDAASAPVELWFAARSDDGRYLAPQRLGRRVNVPDGFAMGPAVDPTRPNVLLFSSQRPGMNRGRSDIYAIYFHLAGGAAAGD